MFTGDSSGDLLYRVLYNTGFASQPESRRHDDGLRLTDAYITASAHCAPPDNKPGRVELDACRYFLEHELKLLTRVRVIVALGRIAFDTYLGILRDEGAIASRSPFAFGHGVRHQPVPEGPVLIASYHPSQQNTSTGKLTETMLTEVFRDAAAVIRSAISAPTPLSRPT
jgi:uracil-DNA glycosylase family 4